MATQIAHQDRHAALRALVRAWDRRWRWQQVIAWLPRSLLPGLLVGIGLALVSRLRPWLLNDQIVNLTIAALALGVAVLMIVVWLWRRPSLSAAQRFDRLFGLQERVSTALELIEGRIHANGELTELQLDDAWQTAQSVRASQQLPLKTRRNDWYMLLALAGVLILLLLLPNPQTQAVQQSNAQAASIQQAKDDLKDLTEQIANDSTLKDTDRQQLLEALQSSMETLKKDNITPEEAFATLSDVQSKFEQKADALNQELSAQQSALQSAGDALAQLPKSTAADQTSSAAAQAAKNLGDLSKNLESLTPQEREDAAKALEKAAGALSQSDPKTADVLKQAADALRNGNLEEARNALQQAASGMQQNDLNQQEKGAAAQNLQQAADQTGNNADKIAQANQNSQRNPSGSQSQNDQGQPGQSNQTASQAQAGDQGDPGKSGQGKNGNQGEQGQNGEAEQPGAGKGGQSGEGNPQPGNSQGDQGGTSKSQQGDNSGAAGAGDQPGGSADDTTGQASQGDQSNAQNNPDGKGEGQYDPIYAPRRPGGTSTDEVKIDPGKSDQPIGEGNVSENPNGETSVPYNQVFSEYNGEAQKALDNSHIPLGLRDVVHDYFSSLEPKKK